MRIYRYNKGYSNFAKHYGVDSKILFNNKIIRWVKIQPYFQVNHIVLFDFFKIVFIKQKFAK